MMRYLLHTLGNTFLHQSWQSGVTYDLWSLTPRCAAAVFSGDLLDAFACQSVVVQYPPPRNDFVGNFFFSFFSWKRHWDEIILVPSSHLVFHHLQYGIATESWVGMRLRITAYWKFNFSVNFVTKSMIYFNFIMCCVKEYENFTICSSSARRVSLWGTSIFLCRITLWVR